MVFLNLIDYLLLLENIVRMLVVKFILFIGNFCLYLLYICKEIIVNLVFDNEDIIIKGKIDKLVLKD